MSNQVAESCIKGGDKLMVNRLDLKILIYFYIKIRA